MFALTRNLTCIQFHLQVCRTSEVVPSRRGSPSTLYLSTAGKLHFADKLVDRQNAPLWGIQLE